MYFYMYNPELSGGICQLFYRKTISSIKSRTVITRRQQSAPNKSTSRKITIIPSTRIQGETHTANRKH